jgi:hypothetical protein
VKLGSARPGHWNGREAARLSGLDRAREASSKAISAAAVEAYADLVPSMVAMRMEGLTLAGITDKLTADGHTTRRGKPWNAVQVGRVLDRANTNTK